MNTLTQHGMPNVPTSTCTKLSKDRKKWHMRALHFGCSWGVCWSRSSFCSFAFKQAKRWNPLHRILVFLFYFFCLAASVLQVFLLQLHSFSPFLGLSWHSPCLTPCLCLQNKDFENVVLKNGDLHYISTPFICRTSAMYFFLGCFRAGIPCYIALFSLLSD